ncbi:MAG TPA: hypothetical protein VEA78_01505 [Acidimicrobiales bacterium]|nr:hypothetical protein [Acidimicrobiales bacterium]
MRVGIAHHLGWAIAVTASADHEVVDRRRIELVDGGLPSAPIHHHGGTWAEHTGPGGVPSDGALAALVAEVRASAVRCATEALAALAADVGSPIVSLAVADWAPLPDDIATLRRPPHEAKADSVMYRVVLAEVAAARGWLVDGYDPKTVEAEAVALLGERAHDVLHGPRTRLGAPWAKDHRTALAATVVVASRRPS